MQDPFQQPGAPQGGGQPGHPQAAQPGHPQSGHPQPGHPQPGHPQVFEPYDAQFGVAPLVPESDGWGKIGIVMVALAVVFAGGVAYFIATSGDSEAEEGEVANAAAPLEDAKAAEAKAAVIPDEVEPAEDPAASTSDAGATLAAVAPDAGAASAEPVPDEEVGGTPGLLRANGEVDRPAGLVSLALESEPPGATVIRKRDGVRLGTTPYRYETEAAGGNVAFILKLDGFRSTSVSMPADKDGVRQVMLLPGQGGVPIPAPEPDQVKPEPKQEAAPAKAAEPEAKQPTPKAPSRPKRPSKPKAPKKPTKPKKPNSGKVDYNPDSIPL